MNESVREYEELMSLYLEGKCTSEQEARLAAWVGEHPDNAHEYHRFRNVWEAEHPAFRFESIDVGKVKRRILESVGENQRKHGIFIEWWKNVAAVLLLPLLILGTVLSYDKYFRKSPEPEWQDFSAPYGVYANIVLPDNSKVCLNSGSTLSYPSRFAGGKRSVTLDGEAYFEVSSDKDHPFSVNVGDMEVTATGTEFNVEAYSGTSQRVTLVTGKLGISVPGKSYALPQGYQLLRDGNGDVSCFRTDTFKWTSWRTGTLAFRGDPLSYVFGRLSSLYDVKIKVVDAEVNDYQIRATFRNEKLDDMMSLIEQTAPIRCQRRDFDDDGECITEYLIYSK